MNHEASNDKMKIQPPMAPINDQDYGVLQPHEAPNTLNSEPGSSLDNNDMDSPMEMKNQPRVDQCPWLSTAGDEVISFAEDETRIVHTAEEEEQEDSKPEENGDSVDGNFSLKSLSSHGHERRNSGGSNMATKISRTDTLLSDHSIRLPTRKVSKRKRHRKKKYSVVDSKELESPRNKIDIKDETVEDLEETVNIKFLMRTLFFTATLTLLQFFCGWVANSLSVLSDAMLMTVDTMTYAINIWVEKKKAKGSKVDVDKADRLGGSISLAVLSGTTLLIMIDSITRLINPKDTPKVNGELMFFFTILNLVADGILIWTFSKSGAQSESINMKSAMLHLIADVGRSLGVLFAGLWIWLKGTRGVITDSICSIILSLFILIAAVQLGSSLVKRTSLISSCDEEIMNNSTDDIGSQATSGRMSVESGGRVVIEMISPTVIGFDTSKNAETEDRGSEFTI